MGNGFSRGRGVRSLFLLFSKRKAVRWLKCKAGKGDNVHKIKSEVLKQLVCGIVNGVRAIWFAFPGSIGYGLGLAMED